jgi:hypothetical protein
MSFEKLKSMLSSLFFLSALVLLEGIGCDV